MPIEGPIQELGLPDVFQLLDLSRKTGQLRVSSRTRGDEGSIYFDGGRVVHATLRSKPHVVSDASLDRATPRELQRKARAQIEDVVFDLMNWTEGFFHFEEHDLPALAVIAPVSVATESLLMESARRIDEWSRIVDEIPRLTLIPTLADLPEDRQTQLDLLPHEWEVLSLVDGRRDLLEIAEELGRGEFEAAKVVYGLITTGVVELLKPYDHFDPYESESDPEIARSLDRGFAAIRAGNFATARENLERFLSLAPDHADAARARAALGGLHTLLGALEGPRD
jgi:Domain of unknown function (DUF4388)